MNVAPTLKRLVKSSKRRWNSRSRAQNFGSHLERLGSNVRHRLGTFVDGGQRKRTFPSVSRRFIHLFGTFADVDQRITNVQYLSRTRLPTVYTKPAFG